MKNANTIENNIMTYEFITIDNKRVSISIEDTAENPAFLIIGPKKVISKAIGGIGEENETEAWATEKELDTEAKRTFAILETLKVLGK